MRRLAFVHLGAHSPCFFHEEMVKPIAHDHVGYRAGGIKEEGIRTAVGKLNAENRMLDDRLVIVFQNVVDAGGQPAAADFVPWMRCVLSSPSTDRPARLNW